MQKGDLGKGLPTPAESLGPGEAGRSGSLSILSLETPKSKRWDHAPSQRTDPRLERPQGNTGWESRLAGLTLSVGPSMLPQLPFLLFGVVPRASALDGLRREGVQGQSVATGHNRPSLGKGPWGTAGRPFFQPWHPDPGLLGPTSLVEQSSSLR